MPATAPALQAEVENYLMLAVRNSTEQRALYSIQEGAERRGHHIPAKSGFAGAGEHVLRKEGAQCASLSRSTMASITPSLAQGISSPYNQKLRPDAPMARYTSCSAHAHLQSCRSRLHAAFGRTWLSSRELDCRSSADHPANVCRLTP